MTLASPLPSARSHARPPHHGPRLGSPRRRRNNAPTRWLRRCERWSVTLKIGHTSFTLCW